MTKYLLGCLTLLLVWTATLSAQTDSAYEKIKPFIKTNTLAVAHVDLENLNLDTMFDKLETRALDILEKIGPALGGDDEVAEAKKNVKEQLGMGKLLSGQVIQNLTESGITELYVLSVLELAQEFPAILVLPGQPELPPEVMAMLGEAGAKQSVTLDGMTLFPVNPGGVDPTQFLNRFKALKTADRPEIEAAMKLQGKSPIRILFGPSMGLKGMAQMMLTGTPVEIDQELVTETVKQVQSVSFGVTPGELRINIAAQFPSEELPQKLETELVRMLEQAMKDEVPEGVEAMIATLKPLFEDFLPKANKNRLIVVINEKKLDKHLETATAFVLLPATLAAREAAKRMQCTNYIKQIGLAFHNYHDTHHALPPLYTVDADGKPLHSWRVLILPFLEETALYEQIRLDEPWDSEHNSQFHDRVVRAYQCPSNPAAKPGANCCYSVIAGEAFVPAKTEKAMTGLGFSAMRDGTSNTIGIIEVRKPFCWMDPTQDVTLADLEQFKPGQGRIGSSHSGGFIMGLLDGSVHFISDTTDPQILKGMGDIDDGKLFQ